MRHDAVLLADVGRVSTPPIGSIRCMKSMIANRVRSLLVLGYHRTSDFKPILATHKLWYWNECYEG